MKNRLFQRTSFFVILVAAISVAVLAQQQQALQISPSVDRLRQHVSYLASDALEGRRTGSPGANDAAHYIAGEFSRLGLRPALQIARAPKTRGEALSRFLQRFPYVAGVQLGKSNQLSFTRPTSDVSINLVAGEEWMPLGFSANAQIASAPATFVGYGITASELKYDDYAGASITGGIALALSGTPDGDNPHGQFARYEDVRWKAIAARNAGAKALIVIAREDAFKEDRLSRLRYENSAGGAGLPVAAISRTAAARLLNLDAHQLSALENDIQRVSLYKITPPPGGTPEQESFTLPSPGCSLSISTEVVLQEVAASNVVGILEGSDPTLKSEALVIGAHYDHLGRGGEGSLAPREGDIHHGADDNASGVAGVLELARIFTAPPRPRRTIMFIAFSGEEEGLLGSNYYVNHPIVPLTNTVAMINMDMIGRMKNKNLIIGGIGTAQEWRSMMDVANPLQGVTVIANGAPAQTASGSQSTLPLVVASNGRTGVSSDAKQFQLTLNDDGYGPSDHSSFYARQIPVLFFWTGTHDDYHKPSDTADKINYEDEARVLTFVARIVRDIDAGAKRLTYTVAKSESTGRSTGFRVYLGTIPNYADSNNGLLLDGVREDSPASKAGLKAGDRVVKMAGHDVRNVYDYTYALGEMKAGQEYELELMRGNERLKLKITPAPRK